MLPEPDCAGAIVASSANAHRPKVRGMDETDTGTFQLDLEGWHRVDAHDCGIASAATTLASRKRHVHPSVDPVWRLRANSSSRRDRAPGFHDTRFPVLRVGETSDLASRTIFPSSIPANSDTPRQKAECARSVCMSITPSCPCAAVGPIVASFHATCMPIAGHREPARNLPAEGGRIARNRDAQASQAAPAGADGAAHDRDTAMQQRP